MALLLQVVTLKSTGLSTTLSKVKALPSKIKVENRGMGYE